MADGAVQETWAYTLRCPALIDWRAFLVVAWRSALFGQRDLELKGIQLLRRVVEAPQQR